MTHRIALTTLVAVIRVPRRGIYAAMTRPDAKFRPSQPSFVYSMWSLANRSALGRELAALKSLVAAPHSAKAEGRP